jgi:hypothetical protein
MMASMARHRFRVDRDSITALCVVWWQGEHGTPPPWPLGRPHPEETWTVERIRKLIKLQRADTPGDLAVLAALPAQEAESSARLQNRFDAEAWLHVQKTPVLLEALHAARGSGFATLLRDGFTLHPGRGGKLWFTVGQIKEVLKTREHVPNLVERRQRRLTRLSLRRGERAPRPRR